MNANGEPLYPLLEFVPPTIEELSRHLDFETDQAKIEAADNRIFVERENDFDVLKHTSRLTLRSLCRNRGLDPTGFKAVLLERIVSFYCRGIDRFLIKTTASASMVPDLLLREPPNSLTHDSPPGWQQQQQLEAIPIPSFP